MVGGGRSLFCVSCHACNWYLTFFCHTNSLDERSFQLLSPMGVDEFFIALDGALIGGCARIGDLASPPRKHLQRFLFFISDPSCFTVDGNWIFNNNVEKTLLFVDFLVCTRISL